MLQIQIIVLSPHKNEVLKMTEKIGILAIGHGSKLPYNKEVVTQIADYIAKARCRCTTGFMENDEPALEEAGEGFSGTGVTKIAAVPVSWLREFI